MTGRTSPPRTLADRDAGEGRQLGLEALLRLQRRGGSDTDDLTLSARLLNATTSHQPHLHHENLDAVSYDQAFRELDRNIASRAPGFQRFRTSNLVTPTCRA